MRQMHSIRDNNIQTFQYAVTARLDLKQIRYIFTLHNVDTTLQVQGENCISK